MAKSAIKEIIIALLLCLAIILILGILLYEYIPITKSVPSEVKYATSSNVEGQKTEIRSLEADENYEGSETTDSISTDDLNNYRRVQDYVPGKANPFSPYATTAETPTENGSSTGETSTSGNTSSNTSTSTSTSTNTGTSTSGETTIVEDDSSSGGEFFQNTGTK